MYEKEIQLRAVRNFADDFNVKRSRLKGGFKNVFKVIDMILTVCPSPCIDVNMEVDSLSVGMVNKVISKKTFFTGKALNVARGLARLGARVFFFFFEYFNIDAATIEEKITKKTKAVLVVHLYGQASNMTPVVKLCKKHNLRLVEDCAQSHGAKFAGRTTGTFGDIGCFSFYPSKNLGAFGDGGAIVTDDEKLAEDVRVFRNYGSEKRYYNRVVGTNSRLDEMQAGLLRVRLRHMSELEEEKRRISEKYLKNLDSPHIMLPRIREGATHIWHQFVIRSGRRQELIDYLNGKEIGTIIHYPIPPHLSEAYVYLHIPQGSLPITEEYADTVLSIPLYNGMTDAEQEYVIDAINGWR